MYKIQSHPILDIPQCETVEFLYNGTAVKAPKGYTIAAALHQAGYPVHSHSIDGRNRSLNCGLGKCGHCRIGETYVCLDGPVFNYTESKNMLD